MKLAPPGKISGYFYDPCSIGSRQHGNCRYKEDTSSVKRRDVRWLCLAIGFFLQDARQCCAFASSTLSTFRFSSPAVLAPASRMDNV
eukprot:6152052-Amphidinium_carterae.2